MTSTLQNDERSVRIAKLETLKNLGVKLYPDRFSDKQDIVDIRADFDAEKTLDLREIDEIIKNP